MPRVFFSEEVCDNRLNPYEAVLLASKESRRLNQVRIGADIPEGEEKVTTVALGRLVQGNIRLSYGNEDVEMGAEDNASEGQANSAGR